MKGAGDLGSMSALAFQVGDQHVSEAVGGFGVSYPESIDRLIQLGLDRHAEKKRNQYGR